MDNPFEKINQRLSNIEGFLIRIDKQGNHVPMIGTPEAPDRYVNRAEAKVICGNVSDPTMWAWEVAGIIKGYKMGSKIFYKYSELMQSGKFVDRTKK